MIAALPSRAPHRALGLAVRCRIVVFAANYRLDRVDRLIAAGRRREVERVTAAVKRDLEAHGRRLGLA